MVGRHPGQRTALIVTVLNEAATINQLLESIAAQTIAPDEVVIVDGGSVDGTWEALGKWAARLPLRLIARSGVGIAAGRNLAIRSAAADLLAVTDAGVLLAPRWLESLLSALTDEVDVVSGFFLPDPRTTFEAAMGATVMPAASDVTAATFLPSSRSILFRRTAWERVGGYPEWLDYCEDLVFDFALREAGCRFVFASDALVWFRPRGSLRAFFVQYYRYARGDGKANLWLTRHCLRYATYTFGAVLVRAALSPASGGPVRVLATGLLLIGTAVYTRRPYARLLSRAGSMSARQAVSALALVPVIRLVGDAAKMLGYPVGVQWRLRTRWLSRSSS